MKNRTMSKSMRIMSSLLKKLWKSLKRKMKFLKKMRSKKMIVTTKKKLNSKKNWYKLLLKRMHCFSHRYHQVEHKHSIIHNRDVVERRTGRFQWVMWCQNLTIHYKWKWSHLLYTANGSFFKYHLTYRIHQIKCLL